MRRIINFRAPLFIAIGLICGIFSFYEFLFGDFWFGVISLICVFTIGVLLFIFKSKAWLSAVVVIVAITVGFGISQLSYYILCGNEAVQQDVTITGRVCDLNRNGELSSSYYLEDCVDENGVKYNGRVQTYIFDDSYQTGDVLTIRGTLNSVYPVKASSETYYLRYNIRYRLDVNTIISRKDGDMKLDETIRRYIYETSVENAPNNGDVMYALLTGDRNALSSEKESYFKSAGIIHLLAVSGLHVGFVVAVLSFLLKRFNLYPLIECGIILIPLIFYAYICNFTPSVIRAIVMVVCTYLARTVFSRYDLLTSLSWAVIIILLISPFNLFDVGFQLSALSVYGIATLYAPINLWINKHNFPKIVHYLIRSLAVSLSCSIATFFTLQLNYGYAPVLGIILNIVVIPLVSVAFTIGWIGMLPWIFHYVLYLSDWIFEAVVIVAKLVASLSIATVSISAIAATAVIVVLWLFVLGGYVNLRKVGKIVCNSVLAGLLVLCVGLSFVKIRPQIQTHVAYGYNDAMCVVTSSNGEAAIVGNFSDVRAYQQAVNYATNYSITHCVLYVTDIDKSNLALVEDALNCLPVTKAYKLDFSENYVFEEILNSHGVELYQQKQNTSQGDYVVVTSVYDGELRAVVMRTGSIVITRVYGDKSVVADYLAYGEKSDVYVLPSANETYSDKCLTTLSLYQSDLPLNYGANKYGTFTFTQKGDTINIKFR